jgi:hypothetical protein
MAIIRKESNPVKSIKVSKEGNSGTIGVGKGSVLLGLDVGF